VVAGEVSWTVARKIVALGTPENEAACLETVRGRTVRAVEAMIEAVRSAEETPGAANLSECDEDHVRVRIACTERLATRWAAAVELARRVSGEALAPWEAAEAIAAEAASAIGAPEIDDDCNDERLPSHARRVRAKSSECGLRAVRWPWLRWAGPSDPTALGSSDADLVDAPPLELDRQFREATAFLQRVDLEIGRILRQILERRLYHELGFESFEDYVVERVDLSARTARRLPRRAGPGAGGRCVPRGTDHAARRRGDPAGSAPRRDGDAPQAPGADPAGDRLLGSSDVARLLLARAGSSPPFPLRRPKVAIFTPKAGKAALAWAGPGRRSSHASNPLVVSCSASSAAAQRAAGERSRTDSTLCAWHHQRGVHGGLIRIRGRAPDDLVFELPIGRFLSGDRKVVD
jgi:hypothetical protein